MPFQTCPTIQRLYEICSSGKVKPAILAVLTLTAVILTIVSLGAGNEIVFTHFFYVPIILAAYWYRFRGVGYTVALSTYYLAAVYLIRGAGTASLAAASGRIVMFISIALVVAVLSEMISRQERVILEKNTELFASNRELAEKENQLRINLRKLEESERNLIASREQLRLILESSAEGIFGIDRKGSITFINPAGSRALGYEKPLDLIGVDAANLVCLNAPGKSSRCQQECCFLKSLDAGTIQNCDHDHFRHRDGTPFPVAYCSAPLVRDGIIEGAVISFEDISDRVKLMEDLKSSLKEKETLLKEIHHRVKNNLQIVVSLLNMQSRYITDKKLLDVIQESQSRVRMMALVHERLYRSGDLSHIDMEDYIRYLTMNLFKFYSFPQTQVTSSLDIKGINLTINAAIPFGLICNELISNSLKYAFPDGRAGEIAIVAKTLPDGSISLIVRDNGIGMPDWLDWKDAKSLGLKLVNIFTEQLDGRISMRQEGGTIWEITIPPEA